VNDPADIEQGCRSPRRSRIKKASGHAADHFVGRRLWIPVNKAMFTGKYDFGNKVDLKSSPHKVLGLASSWL